MVGKIKVALSPFFGKEVLLEEVSGVRFEKGKAGSLNVYDVTNIKDLSGIRSAIRLNALLLLEGELPEEGQEVAEELPEAPKVEEPEVVIEVPAGAEEVPAEVEEKEEAKPRGKRK